MWTGTTEPVDWPPPDPGTAWVRRTGWISSIRRRRPRSGGCVEWLRPLRPRRCKLDALDLS